MGRIRKTKWTTKLKSSFWQLPILRLKVLNTLLNLDKESKFSLTYLDELIAQEIKEEPQPVIDTNIKRTLNHLENKWFFYTPFCSLCS